MNTKKTSRALLIALLWGNRNELHHRAYLAIIKALQCACARYVRYHTDIQGASLPPSLQNGLSGPCCLTFHWGWSAPLWGMIVASWCFSGRGVGTCPHEDVLYFDRRPACFAGLQGQALWVIFIWRRALAPCIARHFIHPERREGWYYRISNHFLKAY